MRVPDSNAATRVLQHRSVAAGPQAVKMLLGGSLINLRMYIHTYIHTYGQRSHAHARSQNRWLLEVALQLRQELAGTY